MCSATFLVGSDVRIGPHQKIATFREMTPEDEKLLEALHEHNSYHDKQHAFLYDLSDEAHTEARRRKPPKAEEATKDSGNGVSLALASKGGADDSCFPKCTPALAA